MGKLFHSFKNNVGRFFKPRERVPEAPAQVTEPGPPSARPTRPSPVYAEPSDARGRLPAPPARPAAPSDHGWAGHAAPGRQQPVQPSPERVGSGTAKFVYPEPQPSSSSRPTPPAGQPVVTGAPGPPGPPGWVAASGAPGGGPPGQDAHRQDAHWQDAPRPDRLRPGKPSRAPAIATGVLAVLVVIALAVFFVTRPSGSPQSGLAGSAETTSAPTTARSSGTGTPAGTKGLSSSSVPSTGRPAPTVAHSKTKAGPGSSVPSTSRATTTSRPATSRPTTSRVTPTTTSAPPRPRPQAGHAGGPLVTRISPSKGAAGQKVVLSGSRLNSANGVITVTFGATQAAVRCPTLSTCDVTVPTLPATGHPRVVEIVLSTTSGRSNAVAFTYL
jgi:IPT/TIG domain